METLGMLLLISLAASSEQSESRPENLSTRLESVRAEHELPAVAGVVVSSKRILAEGVAGVRKVGADVPAELGDLWHIGSLTKSFTSALAGRMVQAGKIQWDSTVGESLPELAKGTPYAGVTLLELLSHRSGLPANASQALSGRLLMSSDDLGQQRIEVAREVLHQDSVGAPGETFLYSNAGYIVAGAILERAGDDSWEDLVRAEVLDPLGLQSAGFGPPGVAGKLDQPRGHRAAGDRLVPLEPGPWADNPPFMGPAGTLHMTVRDLAAWAREHLRGELGLGTLLDRETFQRLHRRWPGGDYALGWVDVEREWADGRRVVWHNGSNTLWYAIAAFLPEADLGVVLVSNGGIGASAALDRAFVDLAKEWLAKER